MHGGDCSSPCSALETDGPVCLAEKHFSSDLCRGEPLIISPAEKHRDPQAMEGRPLAEKGQACEECGLVPFKYKCPGCGLRSCGLACVQAHKERTQCTGKRNRTEFVPLSQFDQNWLISDYNLLEEILRTTEAAKRIRFSLGGSKKPESEDRKALRRQAKNRGTKLKFLPEGMSKRNSNKSFYDGRCKCIFWTIEWRFHSTDVIFVDNGVDEHMNLRSLMEKHLTLGPGNPVLRHKLRHFCKEPLENLKCLLKKEQSKDARKTLDYILDTVSAVHPLELLSLLKHDGKLVIVGLPEKPLALNATALIFGGQHTIEASLIGGIGGTQEMLDSCGEDDGRCMVEKRCYDLR